jgi:hypothetical protein
MTHPLKPAYDMYVEKLEKLISEEIKIKNMLNEFATEMDIELPFPNVSVNPIVSKKLTIGHDDFVSKTGSVAIEDYLERVGTAAKWDDIVEALTQGGYEWNKFGSAKELRSSLVKNTYKFKYIKRNNAFGLKKWYGDEERPKKLKHKTDNLSKQSSADIEKTETENKNEDNN